MTFPKKSSGFSLIELIMVLALVGVLLLMIFKSFADMNQSFELQAVQMALETDLNMALDFIRSDLRIAGYNGLIGFKSWDSLRRCRVETGASRDPRQFCGSFAVFKHPTSGEGFIDIDVDGVITDDVDIKLNNSPDHLGADSISIGFAGLEEIKIKSVDSSELVLAKDQDGDGAPEFEVHSDPAGIIRLEGNEPLMQPGDMYVIQNDDACYIRIAGEISDDGDDIKIASPVSPSVYHESPEGGGLDGFDGATLLRWHWVIYYINPDADGKPDWDSDGDGDSGIDAPQLVRREYNRSPDIIAESVENLQMVYLIDSDANNTTDAETHDPAADTRDGYDFDHVRGFRVTLVGRSPLAGRSEISAPMRLDLDQDGTDIGADDFDPGMFGFDPNQPDSFIRRVMTATINARNLSAR